MILITLIASPVSSADLKYRKRIALMDKGEEVIKDFFNSKSENYYGKKVDAFFADEKNMQRVTKRAEEYAKQNATDTKYITPIIFSEELNEFIFADLVNKLSRIHNSYQKQSKDDDNFNYNNKVGAGGIFLVTTGTFASTIGITAIILAVSGALNAPQILGFIACLKIILFAGGAGAVGAAGAKAALLAGPWGWVIAGGLILSAAGGLFYYKYKKNSLQKEMINTIKSQIEDKRSELISTWRKSFLSK